jgi:hypothetical protein
MLLEEYLQVCLMFALSYAALAALALTAPPPAGPEEASTVQPRGGAETVFMRVRMDFPGRQSYRRV